MTLRLILSISTLLFLTSCGNPEKQSFDLVVLDGMVLDGTGAEGFVADVAIVNDTIAFIGELAPGTYHATQQIDANGYYLTPGFIDTHTHALADLSDSLRKANLNYLFQGVTTVVTGSDGGSVVHIGDKLAEWDQNRIGTNAAIMVGHRTIRQLLMNMEDREPTEEELGNMKKLVAKGMEEGALGFSTGLYYAPASFASTEEVIELARTASENGGMYDAHIRDESSYNIGLLAAIEENIRIAREANIAVNISHIKCLGVDVWDKSGEVITMIEKARNEGLRITADQYPYRASGTHLDRALLPKWMFAGDYDFARQFNDPSLRPGIMEELSENLRRRGGPESILIIYSEIDSIRGKTLAAIAEMWNSSPIAAAEKIILNGSAAIASFNMKESDIENFMTRDWVMTASDGSSNHPRKYGSYPKKIREFVVKKKVLELPEMIRKSTSLPADTYGIEGRGKIAKGYFADLIVFRPEDLKDEATFTEPARLATGMQHVIVNGKPAISEGKYTGVLAGRTIRKQHARSLTSQ